MKRTGFMRSFCNGFATFTHPVTEEMMLSKAASRVRVKCAVVYGVKEVSNLNGCLVCRFYVPMFLFIFRLGVRIT